MMLRQGAIVLIPIPFTDLSSQRRRPVIVISNDTYNRRTEDIVVVAMTSNPASLDRIRNTLQSLIAKKP